MKTEYVVEAHVCSAEALRKCGEVCGGHSSYVFDSVGEARRKRLNLLSDTRLSVSGAKIVERFDAATVKFGFAVEENDGTFWRYEHENLDETRRQWKLTKKRKSTKTVTNFYISKLVE